MAIRKRLWLTLAATIAGWALYVHYSQGLPATVLYIAVVIAAYCSGSARGVWLLAGVCTVFACIGAFLPAATEEPARFLSKALFCIWLPAAPCARALADRTERKKLESIIQASSDAISARTLGGVITSWNLGAESLYGYSGREILGREHAILVPPDRTEEFRSIIEKLQRGESVLQCDTVRIHKDGRLLDVSITISPIHTADGELVGVWSIARDLTERKRLAQSQKRLNEELEQRVQERTAQLEQANEALERSNAELRQFAYVASHDLQTPLRTIAGFAQFLHEDCRDRLDETAQDYIDRIVRGAKRMHELIQDLLELSRVESRPAERRRVDLNDVCSEVVDLLQASIEETGAKVIYENLPSIRGDRSQFVQLFQNLIDNAVKYRGDAPPVVEITAIRKGQLWEITVADNGIGIEAEHRAKIFEIFRRLHSTESYPGTGIGLAICLRIVARHGGKIWVDERPGGGCLFVFTLPATVGAPGDSNGHLRGNLNGERASATLVGETT
jgi:PAS domain S-box-containing protein